jgi:hypothetical protein
MAKKVIGLGTASNDKTGDGAQVAGLKINENFTELYDAVAILQAFVSSSMTKVTTTCNGTVGQVIAYAAQRSNTRPVIDDYEGIGITVTAFDADGFTITSLSAGNFTYIH